VSPPAAAPPGDDRRFANNPFARALHPAGRRSAVQWVALVVVSVLGAAIMASAFLLPLVFAEGLLVGGARAHRWGMVAAGALVTALYALVLVRLVRRRGRR
jgi:hypothetical protein